MFKPFTLKALKHDSICHLNLYSSSDEELNLSVPINSNSPLNNFIHEKYILEPLTSLESFKCRVSPVLMLRKHCSNLTDSPSFLTIVFFLNLI